MKKIFTFFFTIMSIAAYAQQSGTFKVGGDFERFYPVTFLDGGWDKSMATELELGRSGVHFDSDWRGSMIAKFRFHDSQWGNASAFMDADIFQIYNKYSVTTVEFIAGWRDATLNNASYATIIWLRGGGTTYYYKSNTITSPTIYDGVQNPLPYLESGGPSHTFKTVVDSYVNSGGLSHSGAAYFNGTGKNYFAGTVGIGLSDTKGYKLAVGGAAIAESMTVKIQANWPDYVFESSYYLPNLSDVSKYIDENHHLPEVPSAEEITDKGLELGAMNKLLLKKVEELTLYLIEKDKREKEQQLEINQLKDQVKYLINKINK